MLKVLLLLTTEGALSQKRPSLAANISRDDLPPFFLIPPLCGSRLRAWSSLECAGAMESSPGDDVWVNAPLISTQPRCWLECARLWGEDQEDAPGCISRPDEGLDAINTLSQGLLGYFSHSMSELMQALAALGYDPTRLKAMPYDFRLTPDLLERRDGYFGQLKAQIELERKRLGKRAVILAHSFGCKVFAYFLEWVKRKLGDEYLSWVDDNIGLYISNGNAILGSPDIATSVLVGETHGMPIAIKYIHEVLASAGGIMALAPHNGNDKDERPPPLRADQPWLKILQTNGELEEALNVSHPYEFGPELCDDNIETSALRFFQDIGAAVGDSQMTTTAAFLRRLCRDDVFQVGLERPPIDSVHVAYGVGLPTRISTTFELLPGNSTQTLPYFPQDDLEKYHKPSRTWVVAGHVDEIGFRQRALIDETRHVINDPYAPGRSGDDTVPYYSLSAAHTWLGDDSKVSVRSAPFRSKYLKEEVHEGSYDKEHRAMIQPMARPTCAKGDDVKKCALNEYHDDVEPRVTAFESHTIHGNTVSHTIVAEMEGVSHRISASHPVYLQYLQLVIANYIHKNKPKLGHEDLDVDDVSSDLTKLLAEVKDHVPTDDSDCFWIYSRAACAYPGICEYQYKIGDLYLSQSCRLKTTNQHPPSDEL